MRKKDPIAMVHGYQVVDLKLNITAPCAKCGQKPRKVWFKKIGGISFILCGVCLERPENRK